jgi:hypothetical protein
MLHSQISSTSSRHLTPFEEQVWPKEHFKMNVDQEGEKVLMKETMIPPKLLSRIQPALQTSEVEMIMEPEIGETHQNVLSTPVCSLLDRISSRHNLTTSLSLSLSSKKTTSMMSNMSKRKFHRNRISQMCHQPSGMTLSEMDMPISTRSSPRTSPSREILERSNNLETLKLSQEARQNQDVASQADWFLSWNKYKRGVIYLYPHREFEFREYEEYILGQFSAAPDVLIINFDKAIRSRVGRAKNLKLSSIEKFSDLYTSQVLLATRRLYSSSKVSGLQTQSRVRDEVCLRWNKDGKCDFIG